MKTNNLFLLIIVFIVSGCYMGAATYEIFERQRNFAVKNKFSMINSDQNYIKQNYNEQEYIYIRNHNSIKNIPKECVYGFITQKDDPKQIIIRWEILSGKEYCKQQQQYALN